MTTPVWGCPWHGLVERVGSQHILTLPNGQTMEYPTSVAGNRRTGDTYLIKLPGVPEVTRTPEELADDLANGRQWWNKAVLSTQNLHLYGTALNGWIYCDPVGARWRVSGANNIAISSNSVSLTITLKRFGEFQGAEEAFSYSVALADLGQAAPALNNLASRQLQVRDIAPDGSRALLAIVATRGISTETYWPDFSSDRWAPAVGWLELTISGQGASAALGLSVLHTRAETIGTLEEDLGEAAPAVHHWRELVDTVISDDPYLTERRPIQHATSTFEEGEIAGWDWMWASNPGEQYNYQRRVGIILAVWYAPGGGYQRLTYDVERYSDSQVGAVEWVAEGVDRPDGSRYVHTGTQFADRHSRRRVALRLDDVEVDAFEVQGTTHEEYYYTRDDGYWWVRNGTVIDENWTGWGGSGGMTSNEKFHDANFLLLDQWVVSDPLTFCPYELSNHAWCLLESRPTGPDSFEWTWRPTIGPGGGTDGAYTTLAYTTSLRLYGSWCPVTHQLTRGTSRVFWI